MKELIYESSNKVVTYDEETGLTVGPNNYYNYNKLTDSVNKSLNEHYKDIKSDIPEERIYISDKGNLVFQKTYIRSWVTKEASEKMFQKYLSEIENAKLREKEHNFTYKQKKDSRDGFFRNLNYDRTFSLNKDIIENFRIISQRLIIKDAKTFYYSYKGRLRRIKANGFWTSDFADSMVYNILNNMDRLNDKLKPVMNRVFELLVGYIPNLKYLKETINLKERYSYFHEGNLIRYLNHETKGYDLVKNPIKEKFALKEIREGKTSIYSYIFLKKLGIKDVNVFKKLLYTFDDNGFNFFYVGYYRLLKKYYEGKNENVDLIFYNRLNSAKIVNPSSDTKWDYKYRQTEQEAKDSIVMLNKVYEFRRLYKDKDLEELKPNLLKKGLNEIHNYLARVIRCDLAKIQYRDYDLSDASKYEAVVDGYNFLMPRNSKELARLADVFDNCVAGYNSRIDSRESILYSSPSQMMIDYIQTGDGNGITDGSTIREILKKENVCPTCIEINKEFDYQTKEDKLLVNQNYTFNNHRPNDYAKAITKKYFDSIHAKDRFSGDLLPF